MNAQRFLHTIDGISTWFGKAAAWLIIGLMALVCAEVFKRYILNMPTAWIFDASNMLYGTLFMIAGAYTLAQNAHVRGDFLYSSMRPRKQALLDLALYIVFFLPGIAALVYAGWDYASHLIPHQRAFQCDRRRTAGLAVQIHDPAGGSAAAAAGRGRNHALHHVPETGVWPSRLKDVSEIDVVEEQLAHSEHVDEEARRAAIAHAANIEESARQRGMGGDLQR